MVDAGEVGATQVRLEVGKRNAVDVRTEEIAATQGPRVGGGVCTEQLGHWYMQMRAGAGKELEDIDFCGDRQVFRAQEACSSSWQALQHQPGTISEIEKVETMQIGGQALQLLKASAGGAEVFAEHLLDASKVRRGRLWPAGGGLDASKRS